MAHVMTLEVVRTLGSCTDSLAICHVTRICGFSMPASSVGRKDNLPKALINCALHCTCRITSTHTRARLKSSRKHRENIDELRTHPYESRDSSGKALHHLNCCSLQLKLEQSFKGKGPHAALNMLLQCKLCSYMAPSNLEQSPLQHRSRHPK